MQVAGGPKIDMLYGRVDGDEESCGNTDGLPAGDAPFPTGDGPGGHLRAVFYRMGFDDQEIVALSGAHTLGRAFSNRSGANRAPPISACLVLFRCLVARTRCRGRAPSDDGARRSMVARVSSTSSLPICRCLHPTISSQH